MFWLQLVLVVAKSSYQEATVYFCPAAFFVQHYKTFMETEEIAAGGRSHSLVSGAWAAMRARVCRRQGRAPTFCHSASVLCVKPSR